MMDFIATDSMKHTVTWLIDANDPKTNKPISMEQYTEWKNQSSFDGLRGVRYGQSFCNHFDITDNILYYTNLVDWCDEYIIKNYINHTS